MAGRALSGSPLPTSGICGCTQQPNGSRGTSCSGRCEPNDVLALVRTERQIILDTSRRKPVRPRASSPPRTGSAMPTPRLDAPSRRRATTSTIPTGTTRATSASPKPCACDRNADASALPRRAVESRTVSVTRGPGSDGSGSDAPICASSSLAACSANATVSRVRQVRAGRTSPAITESSKETIESSPGRRRPSPGRRRARHRQHVAVVDDRGRRRRTREQRAGGVGATGGGEVRRESLGRAQRAGACELVQRSRPADRVLERRRSRDMREPPVTERPEVLQQLGGDDGVVDPHARGPALLGRVATHDHGGHPEWLDELEPSILVPGIDDDDAVDAAVQSPLPVGSATSAA